MQNPNTAPAAMPAVPEKQPAYVIIRGETTDGKKFRPSDWCDRLHNTLQILGDEAEECAELVQLANMENQKCLVIQKELENINYRLYSFFLRFATDNKLTTQEFSEEDWQSLHNE